MLLRTPCVVIGIQPGVSFQTGACQLGPFARLFLFSDGVYEIARPDGAMWKFEEFVEHLGLPAPDAVSPLDRALQHVQSLHGPGTLEDDFSLVQINFN